MNPGILKEKIKILEYALEDNKYFYKFKNYSYSKVEKIFKKRSYTNFGIASNEECKFTIRYKSYLGLNNAIEFNSKHYLISFLEEVERRNYIEAIGIENRPKSLISKRYTIEKNKENLNRPEKKLKTLYEFEGYIIEKFTGYNEDKVKTTSEKRYILLVPKVIDLEIADILEMEGKIYNVKDYYKSNEYRNEYEIERVEEN